MSSGAIIDSEHLIGALPPHDEVRSFRRALAGGFKLSVAVADQAVFSGANFVLNLLLARWLSASEFGAFALAYAIFLFLAGFHNVFLLDPASVLGPSSFRDVTASYVRTLVRLNFAIGLVLSGAVAVGALIVGFTGERELAKALVGLALATPLVLL